MSLSVTLSDVRLTRPDGRFSLNLPQLRLEPGELVATTGPSGAGKTTLLHLVAGLLRPNDGRVEVGTTRIDALHEGARRRIRRASMGLVLQAGALIPYLTVLENVLLIHRLNHPFRPVGATANRAGELLRNVGLEHMTARFPRQLSAGEQQRVALCRALLTEPAILIADEPTANLDKESARIVAEVLLAHARETGATVLCATHDEALVAQLPRRIPLQGGVIAS